MKKTGQPGPKFEGTYTQGYMGEHPVLGYGPRVRGEVFSRKTFQDELVYEARYTIGPDGLREACADENAERSILFFGGSFMFGEGVNDEQSLPCALQAHLKQPWATYNFGFHGYGPHQMVAALQEGMVAEKVSEPPAHVFYLAGLFHIGRPTGVQQLNGPAYDLDGQGQLIREGFFSDVKAARAQRSGLAKKVHNQLVKSNFYRRVTKPQYLQGPAEVDLFVALVHEAQDQIAHQFPDAQFSIVLWHQESAEGELMLQRLLDEGFVVHNVQEAFEGTLKPSETQLSPHDGHPSSAAFAEVGKFLAEKVVEPK